ncbi:hypothetical protein SI65_03344 [Aspergillus cristatus]|uniref:Uncharacterized protein n=1 Tax=Aspergillus cristatus TaxID=573508 RepID=A0A1E3BHL6_ASPCR|nr:hypothetical protein SI65_03344 [Aspergillus cristatus]
MASPKPALPPLTARPPRRYKGCRSPPWYRRLTTPPQPSFAVISDHHSNPACVASVASHGQRRPCCWRTNPALQVSPSPPTVLVILLSPARIRRSVAEDAPLDGYQRRSPGRRFHAMQPGCEVGCEVGCVIQVAELHPTPPQA